jgi:phospholipid/cholesterol/gamma-HCH transport system substrate-binding protein
MQENKGKYLVVGLVIWVSLFILVFGMLFLNDKNPNDKVVYYHSWFEQVSTLQDGDPVKVNGVKVGKVAAIKLIGRKVLVTIQVREDVQIPLNSQFRVQNIGLLGERQIGVLMSADAKNLAPEDTVLGGFDAGISEAMGSAGQVFDSARVLLSEVKLVVDSTIATPEFRVSFRNILDKTQKVESQLESMLATSDPVLRQSLKNLKLATEKVNVMIDKNDKPIQDLVANANKLSYDATKMMARADTLSLKLVNITDKLNSDSTTVGALLKDKQFYTDLTITLKSADSLFKTIVKDGLDVNVDLF